VLQLTPVQVAVAVVGSVEGRKSSYGSYGFPAQVVVVVSPPSILLVHLKLPVPPWLFL